MKKILILPLVQFFLVQRTMAQTPKWVEKAKRAVFSVITYDKNDKMLNTGNGFFVSEDGLALSDYSLFKGAERAVIVTAEGKQMPVSLILGADDMYDVIKFRVAITEKKVPSLVVATTAPAAGAAAAEAAEEKTEFNVKLKDIGAKKIEVIKAVREFTSLGLAEAKALVESLGMIKEGVNKEEAEKIAARMKEAGAEVVID